MKNKNHRIIRAYVKEIKKTITCSGDIKKAVLHEIAEEALEMASQNPELTAQDLYREIGSPQEIAQGFESRADMEKIMKSAAKYKRIKYICVASCIVAALAASITVSVILSDDDYSSTTHVNSHIEEVTS